MSEPQYVWHPVSSRRDLPRLDERLLFEELTGYRFYGRRVSLEVIERLLPAPGTDWREHISWIRIRKWARPSGER